uniref:Mitochondrial ribosomal protein L37 n=1 Tax=Hucho hucho TaxID=62062 RepID=A0A4W5MAJ7_9TELE
MNDRSPLLGCETGTTPLTTFHRKRKRCRSIKRSLASYLTKGQMHLKVFYIKEQEIKLLVLIIDAVLDKDIRCQQEMPLTENQRPKRNESFVCILFNICSCVTGIRQALWLTKSKLTKGLSDQVLSLALNSANQIENQDERVEIAIRNGCFWDTTEERPSREKFWFSFTSKVQNTWLGQLESMNFNSTVSVLTWCVSPAWPC